MQFSVEENTSHHKFLYQNSINQSFRNMSMYRDNNIQGVRLYDRLHLSEIVYGSKYRGYNTDHVYDMELDYISNLKNVFLIVLVDEPENLKERDDGLGFTSDINEIAKEKEQFLDTYRGSNIKNKKVINIAEKDIPTVYQKILYFIGER